MESNFRRIKSHGNSDILATVAPPNTHVYLDGVEQRHCVLADVDRGFVDVFAIYNDKLVHNETHMLMHRLFGRVEIGIRREWHGAQAQAIMRDITKR